MSNRTGLYAALAAAGVGGYYLYRAGGDPKVAKQEIKRTCLPFLFPLLSIVASTKLTFCR